MNVAALIGIGIFFFVVILFGLLGVCKKKWKYTDGESEDILAHRDVGFFLGTFSLTATLVGGAYINGTVVSVYEKGLSHAQAPWGYALSLILGGLIFAKKMRKEGYTTMLDPLQEKYGTIMGALLSIPALVAELFWSAAVLSLLGTLLSRLLGVTFEYGIIVSVFVVTFYTLLGGLYAILYADILQIFCIFIGLWVVVPFAMMHNSVDLISSQNQNAWAGTVEGSYIGSWLDHALLLTFGGIPRQVYFQRVLAAKSGTYARAISLASALGCIIVAVPAVMIGITAKSTDWQSVLPVNSTLIQSSGDISNSRDVFILVIEYLTPYWVSIIALGGICAAVMSSVDSSILASSSMFSYNVYKVVLRKKASPKEVAWVARGCVLLASVVAGVAATMMKSLHSYWMFSYDLVYVILFPQLLCAVFLKFVNLYGSISALLIAILLRLGGGEKDVGLPAFIKYPFFDDVAQVQLFPFRTFAMGVSLLTLILFSGIVEWWRPTRKMMSQEEINILKISYREPSYETAPHSFAKISRLSGSYNNIAANAAELCRMDDTSFLRTPVSRGESETGVETPRQ